MDQQANVASEAVHRYNGDIGLSTGSRDAIRERFAHSPAMQMILVDEELNQAFVRFEDRAKGCKRKLHRWGWITLLVAGGGLIASAIELLIRAIHSSHEETVGIAGGIASTLSLLATVGALVIVYGVKLRKRWLENRFAAERLRQWHFQTLLDPELVSLAASDPEGFRTERSRRFSLFMNGEIAQISGTIRNWTSDPHQEEEFSHAIHGSAKAELSDELWEAYLWLRVQHQQRHWGAKLAPDDSLARLEAMLRGAGHACFQLAIVVLVAQVALFFAARLASSAAPAIETVSVYATGLSLLLVILSVVFRALDEGFGISREAEHYTKMSLVYVGISGRAKEATNAKARYVIMKDVELWAMTELKDFLLIHSGARFLV